MKGNSINNCDVIISVRGGYSDYSPRAPRHLAMPLYPRLQGIDYQKTALLMVGVGLYVTPHILCFSWPLLMAYPKAQLKNTDNVALLDSTTGLLP